MPSSDPGTGAENNQPSAQDHLVRPAAITLPKGGGAIRGIDEKFSVNAATGTASLSVAIFASPGRSGFGPQLGLSYDSGAGNGPFGLGWSLSIPAITRKTDKGVPQYRDEEDSDTFVLSGAEDLVPVLERVEAAGETPRWARPRPLQGSDYGDYQVERYRPRIEGLFARIERWRHADTGDTFWRAITRDNVTSLYGRTAESRIIDPSDRTGTRVFQWLLERTYDDRGNLIRYEYKQEDHARVHREATHESNRLDAGYANRYIKRIWYGNKTPYPDAHRRPQDIPGSESTDDFLFEVVFDYGEHPGDAPNREEDASTPWNHREDAFSNYRAGFEIRTQRLCDRVLMFHHFAELGEGPCLVRSTTFTYEQNPFATYLVSVGQTGYRRPTPSSPTYIQRSLPRLEMDYQRANIHDEVQHLDADSLVNLPAGVYEGRYQWTDLDGEGIPGVLTEIEGAWLYKRNLGEGKLGPSRVVATVPSLAESQATPQLLDLAGDGSKDFVLLAEPVAGFYERDPENGWTSLTPFRSQPRVAWGDPNLRFVDLDGDGHADVLISEDQVFTWYPSLGEDGFGQALSAAKSLDEEEGPALVFADATQSVYLADMSGDGLVDIARIRNGEVCYWPNLGHGRFGAKVTMDGSPYFDRPDLFDHRRIRLADIDGSGNTDILYLGSDAVSIWRNQAGNSWHEPELLATLPRIDNLSSVAVEDIFGNGTACLVWSSPLPGDSQRPLAFIDLMGLTRADPEAERQQKPHLMVSTKNNLGAETYVTYASSTKFYLEDDAAGRPWVTRLPFPVQVVERVETLDRVSRNRFATRSAYHHGYFDGEEREFRGFGMVEQWDTEEFAALAGGVLSDATNIDATSNVPPVLTRTWFHTGAFLEGERISRLFEHEYYREPHADSEPDALLLEDTVLPPEVTAEDAAEACRALKGAMLRQEVYSRSNTEVEDRPFRDQTELQSRPYTVSETSYTIKRLQPKDGNRHAVFFTHAREAIQFHYERELYDVDGALRPDPRVSHALTLDVDSFGNVKQGVAVAYGRRHPDPELGLDDQRKQTQILATLTESDYTIAVLEDAHAYRTPLPAESRTYELLLPDRPPTVAGVTDLFRFDDMSGVLAVAAANDRPYEDVRPGESVTASARRLIEQVRIRYRPDDLGAAAGDRMALLPVGRLEPLALPGETYKLAFTPGLLERVYQRRENGQPPVNLLPDPEDVLPRFDGGDGDRGGYVHLDDGGHWWIPSGRIFYSPNPADGPAAEAAFARPHFFLPSLYVDPFLYPTRVLYDAYSLLPLESEDPLHNRVTAGSRSLDGAVEPQIDYRTLAPRLMTDPNGNRAAVKVDALGLVVGTAVMGKDGEHVGDLLDDAFELDLAPATVRAQFADPPPDPLSLLGSATSRLIYDLDAYRDTPEGNEPRPTGVCTLVREKHHFDPEPGPTKVQRSYSYSDGFGREIQKKVQAEPGPVPTRDDTGRIVVGEDGQPVMTGDDFSPRWVGSGWTVFNNKGKPVRQYEPFFTDTRGFELDTKIGVSPVLFYDPLQRVVATLHPNHAWSKVRFDPWRQETWDVNDTVQAPNPASDAQVGAFIARLPEAEYLPTWGAQRETGALGTLEEDAARKAGLHADTSTVAYFDTLGRPFLTFAHNHFEGDEGVVDEKYPARVELDIEGNQTAVRDALVADDPLGRIVMVYDYDMLGTRVHQASMEAGERWMLNDVTGKPIRAWDSRGHRFRTAYDPLRRPRDSYLSDGTADDIVIERLTYGESRPVPEDDNLRGKVVELRDQGGLVTTDEYDFKGNLLHGQRQLAHEYRRTLDWSTDPALDPPPFISRTTYDALNRPVRLTTPDRSVVHLTYNEANLLEGLDVTLAGAEYPTPFVADIDYNAKGQRTQIRYGNGTNTKYVYDPTTFRLIRLRTTRHSDNASLQDLSYTYDPVGNITHIRDDAQQTIYFKNKQVEPSADYTYDAIYRLIEATGREHLGQLGGNPIPHSYNDARRVGIVNPGLPSQFNPCDGHAMGTYIERYVYDAVGNFQQMKHVGTDPANPGWTRHYVYNEASLLEPGKHSNRLTRTAVGDDGSPITESYEYDAHGSMLHMPHLFVMQYDVRDQLQMTQRQMIDDQDTDGIQHQGERTWYVYDSNGQRIRKVTEYFSGQIKDERIYLGGFEIYRRNGTNPLVRETLHVMDDKQRIALVETRTQGHEPNVPRQLTRYQFGNHLGSASLELDGDAQIISYEEYTPYGSTSYQAVRGDLETAKHYRYTGMERDEETGLNYHTARYYAPWLGRWASPDIKGLIDGPCLYAYCRCNPVVLHDNSGTNGSPPLPGMVGNNPRVGALWERAVVETLGPRFGATSYGDVVRAFQNQVAERIAAHGGALGSNRAGGTAINYARRTYQAARTRFGRLAAAEGITLDGLQVHHMFDELARAPGEALTTSNLMFARGNAGTVGSGHHFAHQVGEAHAQGMRNPGQHVAARLEAQGVTPDVSELSRTAHGPAAAPHAPPTAHAPVPHGGAAAAETAFVETGRAGRTGRALARTRQAIGTAGRALEEASPTLARAARVGARGGARVLGAVGRVAGPVAIAESTYRLATATNNLDRVQAGADTVAGAAAYAGPVGEAFSVGYGAGQLLDTGVEMATGESLSSRGSRGMTNIDQAISSILPANPSLPEYRQQNRIAWWLIDTFDL